MGLFDTKTTGTANSIQNNTATQTATPWKPATYAWNNTLGQVNSGLSQPATNADTEQGISMLRQLAGQGNPMLDQANGFLSSLYANAQQPVSMNPYMDQVANQASGRAVSGALSQASMAGRYGSNASTSGAVQASMDAQMPYLSQEWNNAQQRQQAAQGMALQGASMTPALDAMRYTPATALMQAGQLQSQNYWDRLKTAGGLSALAGQMGGTKTTTGTGATYGTNANKQDGSDVAGWAGLIGKFW